MGTGTLTRSTTADGLAGSLLRVPPRIALVLAWTAYGVLAGSGQYIHGSGLSAMAATGLVSGGIAFMMLSPYVGALFSVAGFAGMLLPVYPGGTCFAFAAYAGIVVAVGVLSLMSTLRGLVVTALALGSLILIFVSHAHVVVLFGSGTVLGSARNPGDDIKKWLGFAVPVIVAFVAGWAARRWLALYRPVSRPPLPLTETVVVQAVLALVLLRHTIGWTEQVPALTLVSELLVAGSAVAVLWAPWRPARSLVAFIALASAGVLLQPFAAINGTTLPLAAIAVFVLARCTARGAAIRSGAIALVIPFAALVGFVLSWNGSFSLFPPHTPHVLSPSNVQRAATLLLVWVGVCALAVWLGQLLRERTELAVQQRAVAEQSARQQERAALARELHDVVAHHVSLIAVRAETAPYTDPSIDVGGRAVLAAVAEDARTALDELRTILGVLRGSNTAETAPQPGLADLDQLIEQSRRAGTPISYERTEATVPDTVAITAYRIVQEALTNARRHAPTASVTVSVVTEGDVLVVRVRDSGPAVTTPSAEGLGLVGMRERAEALAGELTFATEGGGFAVTARLPLVGA